MLSAMALVLTGLAELQDEGEGGDNGGDEGGPVGEASSRPAEPTPLLASGTQKAQAALEDVVGDGEGVWSAGA